MPWPSGLVHWISVLMAESSECGVRTPTAVLMYFTIIASLHPGVNGYLWGQSWLISPICAEMAAIELYTPKELRWFQEWFMRLMSRGNNVKRCDTSCKSAIKMPSLLKESCRKFAFLICYYEIKCWKVLQKLIMQDVMAGACLKALTHWSAWHNGLILHEYLWQTNWSGVHRLVRLMAVNVNYTLLFGIDIETLFSQWGYQLAPDLGIFLGWQLHSAILSWLGDIEILFSQWGYQWAPIGATLLGWQLHSAILSWLGDTVILIETLLGWQLHSVILSWLGDTVILIETLFSQWGYQWAPIGEPFWADNYILLYYPN